MADEGTIHWPGESGKNFKYWIYKIGASFKKIGGNYIFSKETKDGHWTPIYIGETGDLSTRFDTHHKDDCISKQGATHIHVHANEDEDARLAEEADLIAKWDPPCNG
jgi:hypothetical protein